MGKSNRIRVNRTNKTNTKISTPNKPKKKQQGMPGWAVSLIAIVITLAIICSAVFIFIANNGTFGRMKTAMKTEDYKISQNTFAYYFGSIYSNFVTQNESMLTYFSLDTTKPLKEQTYGKSASGYAYETSYLGAFEGTWFDYFLKQTEAQAKQTLIYCEAADEMGITLEDEDYEQIEATLESLETTAAMNNTSVNVYISYSYGAGVKLKDIRKGLELSALATKCQTALQEKVEEAVTDEVIEEEYANNKLEYDIIDYMMYTVKVSYTDAVKAVLGDAYSDNYTLTTEQEAQVEAKYIELINEAKELADEFAEIDTEEDFYGEVLDYVVNKKYDELYDKIDFDDEEEPIEEPTAEEQKTIKNAMIAKVLAELKENLDKVGEVTVKGDAIKDETDKENPKWTIYGVSVSGDCADELDDLKLALYDNLLSEEDTLTKEGVGFSDTNKFVLGAFLDLLEIEEGDDTYEDVEKLVKGDTKVLYTGDEDLENAEEDDTMYEYFNANVYMLTKEPYQNTNKAKNLAYTLTTDKTLADEIIKALQAEDSVDADVFKSVSEDFEGAYYYDYEDYTKNTFGVAAFDNWLFAKGMKEGTYTNTYITMDESTENGTTSGTYCVAFFKEDGHDNWYVAAKAVALNDTFTEEYKKLEDAHTVESNEKVMNSIGN